MLSPDGTVAEPLAGLDEVAAGAAGAAGVVDEDDEQPAATMAAAAATATRPNRDRDLDGPWPCERGPPRPLFSSSIPYPFRHNALGYATTGHGATRVSFRDER